MAGLDSSSPFGTRPRSAVPSHLVNGSSSSQSPSLRERESLNSSIRSSFRSAVNLDTTTDLKDNHHNADASIDGTELHRETTASRPASPYTLNPPIDYDGLSWPCPGTRTRLEATPEQAEERIKKLAGAVRTIFECIGEDPEREGLRETPERYARAMLFFTKGYEENVRDLVNGAVFHEDHDELVIVKDIEVFSLCEHHMVPFTGKVTVP